MKSLVRRATLAQVRHVSPAHPNQARGLVARVYEQVERDFGMLAPPISLHSPAPDPLAACWVMLRETMLAAGQVSRAAKELVAVIVSRGNTCPYCVDVHGAMLHGLVPGEEPERDPELRRVAAWAQASGTVATATQCPPPAPPGQMSELVAVVVTFHYLNRMVNVFLPDSPFPSRLTGDARRRVKRVVGWAMGGRARRAVEPGAALGLLPAAPAAMPAPAARVSAAEPVPPAAVGVAGAAGAATGQVAGGEAELTAGAHRAGAPLADLGWSAGSPRLARAFSAAALTIERAGRRSTQQATRDLVEAQLVAWDGKPTGLSRAWVDEAVGSLPTEERAAGRLALLTAMASYQVDSGVVAEFRKAQPSDQALIELTSWASLAAARRVASWSRISP
ncbi:MAG: carboxymuconolactone decarboxylase family protein [Micromonosporaceae bacterium]